MTSRRSALAAAMSMVLYAASGPAAAQSDFPNKPIRIVVSFSAGGTTDVVARQVAQRLSALLGQPVVIENRPGAGGTLGTDFVARQPADGYTLLMTSSGPVSISPSLPKKLQTNPLTEIVPVIAVVDVPNVLVVRPDNPATSVEDFVRRAKAGNASLNYGSTGVGTVAHLSGLVFAEAAGFQATHIPYKGADAVTDVIGGRTDYMFATLPSVINLIRGGKLRALASVSERRSGALPDVPTLAETKIADLTVGAWFGMFAPKATPVPVIAKLNTTINEILKEKAVADALVNLGADAIGGSPQDFGRKVMADHDYWKPIVQRSGATAE